ncbi:DUF1853 family protein [Kriegella sp. EG-1]|nr:DUF1853 family protein [Flavobacteriaceae bacterium EG-1]
MDIPDYFLEKQCAGFLNTPELWNSTQFGVQQFNFPAIELTNFSPNPIPQNIRLGHQLEYICKQLLNYSNRYTVLLHNFPIYKDKQTLGEIDFILKDTKTKELIHLELTYKFYIINSEILDPLQCLIGPNKRDSFLAKLEKIKNKQFKLLHSYEGAKALEENAINNANIKHQACFKGQLFKKHGTATSLIQPLNNNCIVGYWLRFNDFISDAFKSFQYYIPSKSEWVVEPQNAVQWTSYLNTKDTLTTHMLNKNSPMVWMKKSENHFEKFFVVWW